MTRLVNKCWVLLFALCLAVSVHAATLLPNGKQTFFDGNGNPLAGGNVTFYIPSTTTYKTTWQDAGSTIANTNPVVLDANGQAVIYGTGIYREVVKDSLGNLIWDQLTADTSYGVNSTSWCGATGGTPNAQTCTAKNFTNTAGQIIGFLPFAGNTGPATLNPNGLGAIAIYKDTYTGPQLLSSGELIVGNSVQVIYDSVLGGFHLLNYPSNNKLTNYINAGTQFGVVADGSTDNATALSTMVAFINSTNGSCVVLPAGTISTSQPLPAITAGSGCLKGQGARATIIQHTGVNGHTISLSGAQNFTVGSMALQPLLVKTSGYEIFIANQCFKCAVDDVRIDYANAGIWVYNSTETRLSRITLRYFLGSNGIYYSGSPGIGSYRLIIDDLTTDNPYPIAGPSAASVQSWTSSTAYSAGQIVVGGAYIWQASQGGTSGSSTPSWLPNTSSAIAPFNTANYVTDGSVRWVFVGANSLSWIQQDSYGYSLVINKASVLDGAGCLYITDNTGNGSSFPLFQQINDLECDHMLHDGISLTAGSGFIMVDSWIGSSLVGNGISSNNTYAGDTVISTSRIVGNALHGILLNLGKNFTITGNNIGNNSQASFGTYNGVAIGPGVGSFLISGNNIGNLPNNGGTTQGYGVAVNTGTSDYYNIVNNICATGNTIGCVGDGGTGTHKTISGNN